MVGRNCKGDKRARNEIQFYFKEKELFLYFSNTGRIRDLFRIRDSDYRYLKLIQFTSHMDFSTLVYFLVYFIKCLQFNSNNKMVVQSLFNLLNFASSNGYLFIYTRLISTNKHLLLINNGYLQNNKSSLFNLDQLLVLIYNSFNHKQLFYFLLNYCNLSNNNIKYLTFRNKI